MYKSMLSLIFALLITGNAWASESPLELIKKAKIVQQQATTYQDWAESEYSPEQLALRLKGTKPTKRTYQQICKTIKKLPTVELYYVANLLEDAAKDSQCLNQQKVRYENYLAQQSQMLLNRTTLQSVKRETLGPSTEIALDNTSTSLIVSGQLPEKTIVLTFDDGPHPTRTSQLLSLLRAEKATVQFFLVGQNTARLNDIVREEQADGHEIGCHSYTHPDLRKMKLESAIAEIENGFSAITTALGYSGSFFRFPYGASTKDLRAHLQATQTTEFLWNIDTLDWKYPDPSYLIDYAFSQIESEGRGVVLFHDIQPQTLAIMPALIERLKLNDYHLAVYRPVGPRSLPTKP